jgi:hypothetical protein
MSVLARGRMPASRLTLGTGPLFAGDHGSSERSDPASDSVSVSVEEPDDEGCGLPSTAVFGGAAGPVDVAEP